MADDGKIVKVQASVPLDADVYGDKVAEYSVLAGECSPEMGTEAPPAWGLPMRSVGYVTGQDLRVVFDDLTAGRAEYSALMLRSSENGEESGKNPSLFVLYDPSDIEGSFRRFTKSAEELFTVSERMGILATVMIGQVSRLSDGTPVIGRENVSFVADLR